MASNIRGTLSRACKRTVSYTEPMDFPIERRPSGKVVIRKCFMRICMKVDYIMLVIVTNSMSGYRNSGMIPVHTRKG